MNYFILTLLTSLLTIGCAKQNSSSTQSVGDTSGGSTGGSTTPPINPPANPLTTGFKLTCLEAQFIQLINIYREQNGLQKLIPSQSATNSSRWHAQNMLDLNYVAHTEPNGRTFDARAASFGYIATGENIAGGYKTANEVFCGWKNSPGHNSNMLTAKFKTTGIGVALGGTYKIYWSNNFGPTSSDQLSQPYTNESGCVLGTSLPTCN